MSWLLECLAASPRMLLFSLRQTSNTTLCYCWQLPRPHAAAAAAFWAAVRHHLLAQQRMLWHVAWQCVVTQVMFLNGQGLSLKHGRTSMLLRMAMRLHLHALVARWPKLMHSRFFRVTLPFGSSSSSRRQRSPSLLPLNCSPAGHAHLPKQKQLLLLQLQLLLPPAVLAMPLGHLVLPLKLPCSGRFRC